MTETKSDIQQSKKYTQFKLVGGNRRVDEAQVGRLKRLIEENGNLTQEFPIVVNERLEVIDGQHRLRALKELGLPVYYRVVENLHLGTVRAINIGSKPWGWRDYADSYAELGNPHYQRLLQLWEDFRQPFYTLMLFTGNASRAHNSGHGNKGATRIDYSQGDLRISNEVYARARHLLTQAAEVADILRAGTNRALYGALWQVLQSPDYDHQRMLRKLEQNPAPVDKARTVEEHLRALEEVYNFKMGADNIVRLF